MLQCVNRNSIKLLNKKSTLLIYKATWDLGRGLGTGQAQHFLCKLPLGGQELCPLTPPATRQSHTPTELVLGWLVLSFPPPLLALAPQEHTAILLQAWEGGSVNGPCHLLATPSLTSPFIDSEKTLLFLVFPKCHDHPQTV